MRRQYAIRFEPSSGAKNVPVDVYLRVVGNVADAIASMRAALAADIANKHHTSVVEVRKALEFSVGPTEKGSLVVPLVPGATNQGAVLFADHIAFTFWGEMGSEFGRVGKKTARISSNAAEALARASALAREAGSKVGLAMREGRRSWKTTTHLTRLETPLRKYAERQRVGHASTIAITGCTTSLTFDPPSMVLSSSAGKRTVRLPASLRQTARECWGEDVVVEVTAEVSVEGDIVDPRAIGIRKAATAEAAAASFAHTFGSLRDVFNSKEAQAYLASLRLNSN